MTISSTINSISYVASGTNDTFPYTFRIFDEADLEVYVNSVLQTITTDYTVTNVDDPNGGNVIFESGSIPGLGIAVVIYRYVAQLQETDYVDGEKFPADTHERALDRLTTIVQQLQDEVNRTFKLSRTVIDAGLVEANYSVAQRKSKFLGFDVYGDLTIHGSMGTWHDDWTTATNYVVGDTVRDPSTNNIYVAAVNHTSDVFATDLANEYWSLVINIIDVEIAQAAAESAAALAQQWAVHPEDDDVDGYPGEFSSLHHAAKSEAWHDAGFNLDPSPDSDHTVSGFNADPLTAGEPLVFGDFCYMKPSDGKMHKADASLETTMPMIAMCMETLAADAAGAFLFRGFARDDSWSWTAGDKLYASTSAPGRLQSGPPSGSANVIQPMGIAITSTVIMLNPVYGYAIHK